MCGRNAVQIRSGRAGSVDLRKLSERLAMVWEVALGEYMVKCHLREDGGINLTAFPDGRVIVNGTDDVSKARSIAARVVGG